MSGRGSNPVNAKFDRQRSPSVGGSPARIARHHREVLAHLRDRFADLLAVPAAIVTGGPVPRPQDEPAGETSSTVAAVCAMDAGDRGRSGHGGGQPDVLVCCASAARW